MRRVKALRQPAHGGMQAAVEVEIGIGAGGIRLWRIGIHGVPQGYAGHGVEPLQHKHGHGRTA
ncbi:hypothetical protein RD110_08645 [Rhodoferax koreense]|uniref:Uncharacterized protein n=1 Tax=Rhodoferax koreensis TaxID=1842727 RepID=A0A1P8JU49_9BURK|nr:hypothetical protein RD110_08645 [Rhodoferax koreense]